MKIQFAERLKELRKESNLTQSQLAKQFNVSHTTIYHWENGKQQPSLETFVDMMIFFKVNAEYLLGIED